MQGDVKGGSPISVETELARKASRGSRKALGDLLARYENRLERFVRASLRNGADAEDCLQEIRLRVTRSISRFHDGAPFEPWFFRVAGNAVRNAISRNRRSPPLPAEVADPAPGVATRLIVKESADAAWRALRGLPDRYREVLLFRLQQGLSHREIARSFEISEGAARVLFCRALKALRAAAGGSDASS